MKVERKGGEYKPIVITLETEEEADALWYALDVDDHEARDDYLRHRDEIKDADGICDRIEKIFCKYDNVHTVNDY